jgi:uncharacterized protein (TIGR00369 family)
MPSEADPLAITLSEPVRGSRWGSDTLELSGLDRLQAGVDRKLPDSPVMRLTGFRITDVGPGTTTVSMPASPWWQTSIGVFTPGTLAFVADAAASGPYLTTLPPRVGMTTSQLLINFLRTPTVESQTIVGRGRLLHSSHAAGLAEAFLEDAKGKVLAHCTARSVAIPIEAHGSSRPRPEVTEPVWEEPDPYLRTPQTVDAQERWTKASGIERLRYLQSSEYPTPMMQLLGLRARAVTEGEATMTMAASKWLNNYGGTIYGGATTCLAEGTCTAAVLSTLPAGSACAPLDVKINFLRPILPFDGDVIAKARVVHKGMTMAIVQCEVTAQDKLVAIANESALLLHGRSADKPVHVAEEVETPPG